MSLDGLAAAIYQRRDGQHVVSATSLSSTSDDQIFIEQSTLTEIDPAAEHTNGRTALLTILEEISSRRAQIEEIGDNAMLVPLTIVHGVAERHDQDAYTQMIRSAFPEYFSGTRAPAGSVRTVNGLLQHLMKSHHADHAPQPAEDEPPSQLALQDFTLFHPDDPRFAAGFHVTTADKTANPLIEQMVTHAKAGHIQANTMLLELAQTEARSYAKDLRDRGILDSTRFVQFGLHSQEFRDSARYTYLEYGNLKDIFVRTLISELSEPHHVAMKTPHDSASPAFADITTTFLADVWRVIRYHRTGTVEPFKNVTAKRQG